MQIVIDISDQKYKWIVENPQTYTGELHNTIRNGTPLPEHHGRIIDESQIRHIMCHTEQELHGDKIRYVKTTDAPTIIEAEGSENE